GVSSHWRIRHKLMLGLGLVVVVMALLLGGTLYGLWSNYVTINSIRYKTAELFAAEKLKAAIARLLSPSSIRSFSDRPDAIDPGLAGVLKVLRDYEEHLQDSLNHGLDPTSAAFAHGQLDVLKAHLDGARFSKAVEELFPAQATVKSSAD